MIEVFLAGHDFTLLEIPDVDRRFVAPLSMTNPRDLLEAAVEGSELSSFDPKRSMVILLNVLINLDLS